VMLNGGLVSSSPTSDHTMLDFDGLLDGSSIVWHQRKSEIHA